ncbi:MarR family transcriptional regulator [Aureimonas leprariae]|uniref:MarR family transcriptional regulator n=1 Tax=Plantimonas leprariae TaxID=2615207 RepID=A0A7V7PRL1_9HYPH|nr:MarR family transcriptional regulator [Aureimonas leprariae]KAB0681323.1 MarR family transcriptional regulator [Aureimonas leprariae]
MTKRAGPRYAIIPADAVTDKRLIGKDDLRALALLGRHIDGKGWCTRTQGRMAAEMEIARGALQRSLGRLVDAGYVEVRHEKRRDGGQAANSYRVVLDDAARADQIEMFFGEDDEATRKARPAKRPAPSIDKHTPASPVRHPLPHLDEAPPASPGRGTHKERPLQETSPCDTAAAAREPLRPANDHPTKAELDALEDRLRDAAGLAIDTASPNMRILSEPLGWLAGGCDLDLDIVPVVASLAARHRGRPIRSWGYFGDAVKEARERRLAAALPRAPPRAGTPEPTNSTTATAHGSHHGQPHRTAAEKRVAGLSALASAFARRQGPAAGDGDG